ncbi:hypothetical protein GCM10010371_62330 [Streptomyces subrutilus]|uniref:MFS transporter n=1 Tax=Streptomyces subrutilus TaxID=36818 RepID=A0A918RCU5_9ACTN|nr:hypothetical protein GCM10010371_62330 [Streptomyces subrutilus]
MPSQPARGNRVTRGLAMSAGGLFMPLLGMAASHYGPRGALALFATVPVLAMLLSAFLREPDQAPTT